MVLHGPSTLTISLPYSWIRKFNIKKGDELEVEEEGKELKIKLEGVSPLEKKEITIGDLNSLGKINITSAYRQGYEEIEVKYADSSYLKNIQEIIMREITGFEIIRQDNNKCVLRDITGHTKDEFDNAINRMWLLIIDLSSESLEAVKDKDSLRLKNIQIMDQAINKFSNYCLRILIKKGDKDYRKTLLYYHLIKSLEETADRYKDLCNICVNNLENIDKDFINQFLNVNNCLSEFHKLFYRYNEEKMEDLMKKVKSAYNNISHSQKNIEVYLSPICKDIHDLLGVLTEIKL